MIKTALITGASSGFGVEFARNFARDGHNVVLVARRVDRLEALAQELRSEHKVEAFVLAKDLSDMKQVQEVYDEIAQKNIQIDFLVNNAGFGDFGAFLDADWQKLEQMVDVNIKALTKLTYLYGQDMRKRNAGKILNIASTAAFQPGPLMATYYATKSYVLFLSEALSNELEGSGVTVTTLCPGATATEFDKAANLGESKLFKGRKLPTAKEVVDFGYKHMMKGSMTVVPGFMNRSMVNFSKFIPRKLALKIVRSIQS